MQTNPASANSAATADARRIFSRRSSRANPRSALRASRTLSPSSTYTCKPSRNSRSSNAKASVELARPREPCQPEHPAAVCVASLAIAEHDRVLHNSDFARSFHRHCAQARPRMLRFGHEVVNRDGVVPELDLGIPNVRRPGHVPHGPLARATARSTGSQLRVQIVIVTEVEERVAQFGDAHLGRQLHLHDERENRRARVGRRARSRCRGCRC